MLNRDFRWLRVTGFLLVSLGISLAAGVPSAAWAGDEAAAFASDERPATALIGVPVHADATPEKPPVGTIADLVLGGSDIADVVIDTPNGRLLLPFEHLQVFPDIDGHAFVVASNETLGKFGTPYSEDETARLLTRLPEAERNILFRPQALNFTYYGGNAVTDIANFLAKFRAKFGDQAFRTEMYTVQAGDTVCGIYETKTQMPVTRTHCPQSAENLFAATNPDMKGPAPQVDIQIPMLDIFRLEPTKRMPGSMNYLIRLPVDASMAEAFFEDFDLVYQPNVAVDYTYAGRGEQKYPQSAEWEALPGPDRVCQPEPAPAREKSFYYVFDWLAQSGWEPPDAIKACALKCRESANGNDAACADVVLVDQLLQPTNDITDIRPLDKNGEAMAGLSPPSANACTPANDINVATQHGTHMASIIGSKADGKGYVGLSPGLDIFAYPWADGTLISDLARFLQKRVSGSGEGPSLADMGPQVFVFASYFPSTKKNQGRSYSYPDADLDGSRLKTKIINTTGERVGPEKIRMIPAMQKTIQETSDYGLWVVAALQKDSQIPDPLEINAELAYSPVNLGDLPNVIVVTACDECSEGKASVWKDAFYSSTFVHVAAPGMKVVAPVGEGRYAVASGTSQATAIVGGLVGAMVNCYPDYYRDGGPEESLNSAVVKQRLQYTSKPIFYKAEDLARVASGVVDPQVALLDPEKNWIKLKGAQDYTELTGNDDIANWCEKKIELVDDNLVAKAAATQNVVRMVRVIVPDGMLGQPAPWVLYSLAKTPGQPVAIQRFDPRVFEDAERENVPIARKKSGDLLYPRDFDDLVLAKLITSKPCPAP